MKIPSAKSFNIEFERFIDSRVNEMARVLRRHNRSYIESFKKIEKLQSQLKLELNEDQMQKVNEIVDTLNYVSGIEIYTAYKMAINDFNNLK